eukprot:776565-Ditylum_brightwellii.AAC.1
MVVKRCINTIFGAICVVVVITISVVSCQPCQTKDTADSANADPQTTQKIHFHQQQQKSTTFSCRVPLQAPAGHNRPHHHHYHGNTAPSSDTGATFLAPKSGHGTNNAGCL